MTDPTPGLKANILVVNDRSDQLVAMETLLAPLQENLFMARSGEEALRLLLHHEFAVVLLDVLMPGMDGFETASLIRQRGKSRSTPIIFVTAHGQGDAQVTRSYSLGAVDYIQTPVVPEILRAKVGVFVQLYKKSEELRRFSEAEHQRQLHEANERLEAETKRNLFFVLSVDLLAVAGFDGYLKQINPAWEKALGFPPDELKGAALHEFAHPDDQAAVREQLDKLRSGTAITYFENRFCSKDGGYRWLGWTATPFAAEQLIYIFAREITARKAAENEIRTLNRKLQERVEEVTAINKELEAFSYSISHDLRAPLRSMQSFAQLVLSEYSHLLPEPGREMTGRIVESARYMDRLLRDLLEYSRLSQSELPSQRIDLEATVAEVLVSIQQEISDKKADIQVNNPLQYVLAHPGTLNQILSNLISNALKFVERGKTPRVRISTEVRDGRVRVWVEDNGIGIRSEEQEKIFGLFQRLHHSSEYPGTGIGLAIVRKGVERMGGQIGVESQVGKGSRFWLELPDAASNEEAVAEAMEVQH